MSAPRGKLVIALRLAEMERRVKQIAAAEAAARLRLAEEAQTLATGNALELSRELVSLPGTPELATLGRLSCTAADQDRRATQERTAELLAALADLHEKQVWTNAVTRLIEKRHRQERYREERRSTTELVESALRRIPRRDDVRS